MTREIEALVRRFRTRARVVILVRSALGTGAVASVLTAFWMIIRDPSPSMAALALAANIALVLVVAMVWTIRRSPSMSQTADEIDRVCNLQNRVGAALRFANDPDAIAALIVRDAWRCVQAKRPADVFPFGAQRHAAVAALCLAGALVTLRADVRLDLATDAPDSAPSGFAVAGDGSVRNGESVDDRTARTEDRPNATPVKGSNSPQSARSSSGLNSTAPAASAPDETNRASRSDADGGEESNAAAKDSRTPEPRNPADSNPSKTSSALGAVGSNVSRSSVDAVKGNTNSGAGGAAAAGTAATGERNLAGGIAGGASAENLSPMSDGALPRSVRLTPAATAASLRGRADAALARDDIPPGLRRYVRDFFLRLPAVGTR